MKRERLVRLRQLLVERLNDDELQTLCYDLDVDYDELAGKGKTGRVRELLGYLKRRELIAKLLETAQAQRPDVPWNEITQDRIFVGYTRHAAPDRQLAFYLQDFLTAQGHHVFIDTSMRTGVAWLNEIDQQIKNSDVFIVLLSESSADSEMVQAEVQRAYQYRKQQGHPQILPVRLAFEGLLPYAIDAFVNPLQYVVWNSAADNERLARDILAAIEGRLPDKASVRALPTADKLALSEDGRPITDDAVCSQPLPEFDPRFLDELQAPGGTLKPRDKFYIERQADAQLKRQIVRPGAITTIRAARQTGKSSLLVRGVHHARQTGAEIVNLDLQRVDPDHLGTPDIFLRYLAEFIVRKLRLDPDQIKNAWKSSLGPQDKLTYLMEDYILYESDGPIVLAMDEVDRLLSTAFYGDFFALIRSWHNSAAYDDLWEKLNIVLVISTEPYLLISDLNQSPFNVGLRLYLEDFDAAQVQDLNRRHGSPLTDSDLTRFVKLLGGHPYLTRKALYALVTRHWTLADLMAAAATDQGPFSDHLRRYHWLRRDKPPLREALKSVIQRQTCSDDILFFRLLRAGLVKGSGDVCRCRCDLYRLYFEDKL